MDETVLAESTIAHEVLEQTADCLIRGQRFAGPPDEAWRPGAMTDARLA
jgi:hypothetical protein